MAGGTVRPGGGGGFGSAELACVSPLRRTEPPLCRGGGGCCGDGANSVRLASIHQLHIRSLGETLGPGCHEKACSCTCLLTIAVDSGCCCLARVANRLF